jgi:hypothetical protein
MLDALRSGGEEWYSFLYLFPEERRKKKDVTFNSKVYINCHQLLKTKMTFTTMSSVAPAEETTKLYVSRISFFSTINC